MAFRPQPFSDVASVKARTPRLTLLLLCAVFAGCGRSATTGGPPAGEAPSSSPESPKSAPETLEQAEAELEQARLALAQLGGGLLSASQAAPAAAGAPSPTTQSAESAQKRASADEAPPPPKASRAPSRSEKEDDQDESEGSPRDTNPCQTTCKAYASLLRAKNAVCRLDAPNGARCARAEGIVRDAMPQVQSCQCAT